MKKPLEFQLHKPGELELIQPSDRIPFQDLFLKLEYSGYKYTLPKGSSSFRLLPALKGSPHWMASVMALDHGQGRHAHPGVLQPEASSVFDVAQQWLKNHKPDALYAKNVSFPRTSSFTAIGVDCEINGN